MFSFGLFTIFFGSSDDYMEIIELKVEKKKEQNSRSTHRKYATVYTFDYGEWMLKTMHVLT